MKEVKSIFKSKTMWLNAIAVILAVAVMVDPELLNALGIEGENQMKVLKLIGAVTGILNLVLRMLNGAPVALNPKKDA